jgi:hypothetical protein
VKIVREELGIEELKKMAAATFGDLVKAVVDIDRGIVALDGELHSDLEAMLLEDGSRQVNLWGINLYPELAREESIEFDSLINIRPSQGNRTRGVEDEDTREKILSIVKKRIIS